MYCFAYSGGTVLSKCLGAISKDVVLISEVNPLFNGIKARVAGYHLPDLHFSSKEFVDQIVELQTYCNSHDKFLIVRDWTYINFHPHSFNGSAAPPNRLLLHECLKEKTKVKGFAFVRDAIDVCISHSCTSGFFNHYEQYVEELTKYPEIRIFKYEDFCRDPENLLQELCDYIELEYSEAWKNFASFTNVSGDTGESKKLSRGGRKNYIFLPKRKRVSQRNIKRINQSEEMRKVNQLLGYPTHYNHGYVDQSLKKRAIEEARPYWQGVKKIVRAVST